MHFRYVFAQINTSLKGSIVLYRDKDAYEPYKAYVYAL